MISENDKREDKFLPMTKHEINYSLKFALRNGDRKIAYCKSKDNIYYGGMADSFEDALDWCKKFYEEDNTFNLCIRDYTGQSIIWDTNDILKELGFISSEEYNKRLRELSEREAAEGTDW